jgi:hypothetical protein
MDDRRDTGTRGDSLPEPAGEDVAVFRVACVGGGSAAPVLAATLATVSIGAFALTAALGQEPRAAAVAPSAARPPAMVRDVEAERSIPTAVRPPGMTRNDLAIHTRAWGPYVYVQGDVAEGSTVLVVVSIRDADGEVLQVTSLTMPYPTTAAPVDGRDRFRMAFDVSGTAAKEVALVVANAYDRAGVPIATVRQRLSPAVDPGWWRGEGAR